MKIERAKGNRFSTCFDKYSVHGFHATSSRACSAIERVGIFPDKIFGSNDHKMIIDVATDLGIDTSWYQEWLSMRSISFAKRQQDAVAHVSQGHSGGQGLVQMLGVLEKILSAGSLSQRNMAQRFADQIQEIRAIGSVVYAVDLSNLGKRLVQDPSQSSFLHVYFDQNAPLPEVSVVTPDDLIARLDIT